MLKKTLVVVSFILFSICGTAQKDINNYKYIIVPKKFDFLKSEDKFQLNSLTKFLFNKYGYEAYFGDDDLPQDLRENRCLALISDVSDEKGGLFVTKIEIILKDCFGSTVMTSAVGETRTKEYKKAYNEAIREAFKTFQNIDYKYVPLQENINVTAGIGKSVVVAEAVNENIEIAKVNSTEQVSVVALEDKVILDEHQTLELHYAQPINNGFQLVDSEPKIVMILLNTAAKDVFLVKDRNAIVFKVNDKWVYSENNGDSKKEKELNIKF